MKKLNYLILTSLSVFFLSCENEPFDILAEKIDINSELFVDLKTFSETIPEDPEVVCLTFVYPFNVFLYDQNGNITEAMIINNNREFIIALDDSEEQQENAIGLSYPISGNTSDGNSISINNNSQLKEAIKICIKDQIILYSGNLVEEKNCVWKIESQTENDLYNNSLLDFYNDGTGVFYHQGDAFRTSWIFLFIEEQLHLNIRLEGDTTVSEDWDFDWLVTIIDDNTILIDNEQHSFEMKKSCNIENNCDYVEFRECTIEDVDDTAEFIFKDYIDCILSFDQNVDAMNIELSFHKTIDDANAQENPLDLNGYTNITNPQIIFVNKINIDNEINEVNRIVLFAEECN